MLSFDLVFLRDVLDQGIRIGVIASSDHGLVHAAYAGLYVREFTRQGILEAVRARRTFGATTPMVIEFRAGEALLGETLTATKPPRLEVAVRGTAKLKQVQVIRNGRVAYTVEPGKPDCRFDYSDPEPLAPGRTYYYVRCDQEDGEQGWSSAIWVEREK